MKKKPEEKEEKQEKKQEEKEEKQEEKEEKQEEKEEKEEKQEEKEEKEDNKKIYKLLKPCYKVLCCQIFFITALLLLYCNYYNYQDTLVYFNFGSFISIYLIAIILLIKKYDITISINFNKKYNNYIFKLLKKYTTLSEKIISIIINIFTFFIGHLLFLLLALYYVKDYIKVSIKTDYACVKAIIIFTIFFLFNIYIIDSFKVYNKSLELTKTEFNIILTSIVLTFIGLLYYFESIKNTINN